MLKKLILLPGLFSCGSLFAAAFEDYVSRDKIFPGFIERGEHLSIAQENVPLPSIPQGSKVLDVGAGRGVTSQRMRDAFNADVYALEPNFESSSNPAACIERLGSDHVDQVTLQEALSSNPAKYYQAFDVVCVFNYSVMPTEKDNFINALSQVVKPTGYVYITTVDESRLLKEEWAESMYLVDTFFKYFSECEMFRVETPKGRYHETILSSPYLS